MKYAAAMRYGGELVNAADCDHQDYRYLGLLCPECKDPVFLKATSTRTQKDKTISVSAHFSHFKSKDPALALQCEQRVQSYTPEELQRRATQARGQRLRLLQRWFWQIICQQEIITGNGILTIAQCSERLEGAMRDAGATERSRSLLAHQSDRIISLVAGKDLRTNILDDFLGKIESNQYLTLLNSASEFDVLFRKKAEHLHQAVDLKMHRLIVHEVFEFLSASRQHKILQDLTGILFVVLVPKSLSLAVRGMIEPKQAAYVASALLETIITTPWAEEFSKLQK